MRDIVLHYNFLVDEALKEISQNLVLIIVCIFSFSVSSLWYINKILQGLRLKKGLGKGLGIFNLIKVVMRRGPESGLNFFSKSITPHLTIYYPLETALISVLIRFMGILACFLLLFSLAISLNICIYNTFFFILLMKLILKKLFLFIIVGSIIFHTYKVYTHF